MIIRKFNKFESKFKNTLLFSGEVDLRGCKRGDILISCHGFILEYISTTPWRHYVYLDHVVRYIEDINGNNFSGGENYGTRTDKGYTFRHNRKLGDNNIVLIIPNIFDINFINSVKDSKLAEYLHSKFDRIQELEAQKNVKRFNI